MGSLKGKDRDCTEKITGAQAVMRSLVEEGVEVIFGYPGLGSYLLDSALFKDFNAIEAGAIVLVAVAVGTQLLADVIYTFINPRIRYG